jgi:hypothetical protein
MYLQLIFRYPKNHQWSKLLIRTHINYEFTYAQNKKILLKEDYFSFYFINFTLLKKPETSSD